MAGPIKSDSFTVTV